METTNNYCLQCNTVIAAKRIGTRFCTRKCQYTAYNAKAYKKSIDSMDFGFSGLVRSSLILRDLYIECGEPPIETEYFLKKKFFFNHFLSFKFSESGAQELYYIGFKVVEHLEYEMWMIRKTSC